MDSKDLSSPSWTLLSDSPPGADEDDDFKTTSYSIAIAKLALSSPTPFTLGLFGAWGEGKTTVVGRRLERALRKLGGYSSAYVYFDCWKYQDDPFRRQLIRETAEQLDAQGIVPTGTPARIADDFYQGESRDVRRFIAPDRSAIAASVVFGLVSAAVLALSVSGFRTLLGEDAANAASGALPAALWGVAAGVGAAFVARGIVTIERASLSAPEEFEKRFSWLLDHCAAERIVVVIDNLDRTADDRVLETLATIKSFAEHSKLVYVVPCDDGAIKRVLARSGHQSIEHDDEDRLAWADEFLRKFFNAQISMASHLEEDVRSYTDKILAAAGIADKADPVADVVLAALRRSPRRIKQLVNVLVSRLFVLAANDVPILAISPIAKVVVLEEYWPDFVARLRSQPGALAEATSQAINAKELSPEVNWELRAFLRATANVDIPDPIALIQSRRSSAEAGLPDALLFKDELALGQWEAALARVAEETATSYAEVARSECRLSSERPAAFGVVAVGILRLRESHPAFDSAENDVVKALGRRPELREQLQVLPAEQLIEACVRHPGLDANRVLTAAASSISRADIDSIWRSKAALALAERIQLHSVRSELRNASSHAPLLSDSETLLALEKISPDLVDPIVFETATQELENGTFAGWESRLPLMSLASARLEPPIRVRLWTRLAALNPSEPEAGSGFVQLCAAPEFSPEERALLDTAQFVAMLRALLASSAVAASTMTVIDRLEPDVTAQFEALASLFLAADVDTWTELAKNAPSTARRVAMLLPAKFYSRCSSWDRIPRQGILVAVLGGDQDVSAILEPAIEADDRGFLQDSGHAAGERSAMLVAASAQASARRVLLATDDDARADSILGFLLNPRVSADDGLNDICADMTDAVTANSQPDVLRVLRLLVKASLRSALGSDRIAKIEDRLLSVSPGLPPSDPLLVAIVNEASHSTSKAWTDKALGLVGLWLSDTRSDFGLMVKSAMSMPDPDTDVQRELFEGVVNRIQTGIPIDSVREDILGLLRQWRSRRNTVAYKTLQKLIEG